MCFFNSTGVLVWAEVSFRVQMEVIFPEFTAIICCAFLPQSQPSHFLSRDIDKEGGQLWSAPLWCVCVCVCGLACHSNRAWQCGQFYFQSFKNRLVSPSSHARFWMRYHGNSSLRDDAYVCGYVCGMLGVGGGGAQEGRRELIDVRVHQTAAV